MDGEQEDHKDGRRGRISPRDLLRALPPDTGKPEIPKPKSRRKRRMSTQHSADGAVTVDATGEVVSNAEAKPKYKIQPRWKPGESGNPSGLSKKHFELQAIARAKSPRAFERVVELVESPDERIALMASKEVLERAFGRARVNEDDTGKGGVTINIVKLAANETPEPKPAGAQVITLKRFSDA